MQFGITDSKGRMYQAPLAGYLPKGRLPARKWVRVTVPWKAFPGLKPKTVQMHSVWLKVRLLHASSYGGQPCDSAR